jgi:hypothetical protein
MNHGQGFRAAQVAVLTCVCISSRMMTSRAKLKNSKKSFHQILHHRNHNRPISGRTTEWTQLTPSPTIQMEKKKKHLTVPLRILRISHEVIRD